MTTPCQERDPEIWFPGKQDRAGYLIAKALCNTCPMWARVACLEKAMAAEGTKAAGGRDGVFGGLDEKERARLARQRRARLTA